MEDLSLYTIVTPRTEPEKRPREATSFAIVVQNMSLEAKHICTVCDKIKVQNFFMEMQVVKSVPTLGRKFAARYKDKIRSSGCRQEHFWVLSDPRTA